MTCRNAIIGLVSVLGTTAVLANEFRNLGFDEADLTGAPFYGNHTTSGEGDSAKLSPGWDISFGATKVTKVGLNEIFDGIVTGCWLFDNGADNTGVGEGRFSIVIDRSDPNGSAWTLSQAGTIPSSAEFLTYRLKRDGEMQVFIDDELIAPKVPLDQWTLSTNLVYEISRFAGREVKLSFIGPIPTRFSLSLTNLLPDRLGVECVMDSVRFIGKQVPMKVTLLGKKIEISWPSSIGDVVLQVRSDLGNDAPWATVDVAPVIEGARRLVSFTVANESQYFRLGLR